MSRRATQNEAAHLRKAVDYEKRERYEDAAKSLVKALEAKPDNADTWRRLGEMYQSMMRIEPAIEAFRRSVELNARDMDTHECLMQAYLQLNRIDEAISHAKGLLKRWPRSLCARDALGSAYLQLGQFDDALRVTDELVRLDPTDPTNHYRKAVLFQQKGEVGLAIKEFARVIEMAPVDSPIIEQAQQMLSNLDGFQLRQIVSLASEDNVFRMKLTRDAEQAAMERGFVLSYTGLLALRQIPFENLSEDSGEEPPGYYHYH